MQVLTRWTPLKWASKMNAPKMDALYTAKAVDAPQAKAKAGAAPAAKRPRLSLADM